MKILALYFSAKKIAYWRILVEPLEKSIGTKIFLISRILNPSTVYRKIMVCYVWHSGITCLPKEQTLAPSEFVSGV
jgi:hypothetical protein